MDSGRILIVDDELILRESLARWLERDGHKVTTAANGEEGLELIKNDPFDIMLADIKMPGMSGIELYHCIQATDPALAQRILFITGDVLQKTTRDFFAQTKMHYIAKPFTIEQLKKEINRIFSSAMAYHI